MNWKKVYVILDFSLWIINPLLVVLAIFDQRIQPGLFFQDPVDLGRHADVEEFVFHLWHIL